jgi:penicillin amidase
MARRPRRTGRGLLRTWLTRLALGLLGIVVLAAGLLAGGLWLTLPSKQGQVQLPGLSSPASVTLDEHGVPSIAAATETDAAMVLGWLHARDRLFEMEMMRRGAAGRLSELLGSATLRSDRFVRTLGLARRARADLAALPAETRAVLEAYAAGVNAWIAAKGRFAAPEFLALGAPEPWLPEHSLLWGKVMGLWLSGNWRGEIDRARLSAILPADRLEDLWPRDASPGRPDQWALDPGHLARLAQAVPQFPEPFTQPGSASNAWAVAGSRSVSGAPLLASDPHLGFQAPILWYLARIDLADGRMLAGATSPGVPFVVIGRSRDLAWGFTTTQSDTQDVFAEKLAGPDGYETPEGPQPFAVVEERIGIRGRPPEILRVRESRHGPIISDLDGSAPAGMVLALSAANLAPADSAAAGLLALNRARDLDGARAAAALITSPSQNLMTADAAGRIGLFLTGRTPLRRSGDGRLPVAGWDGLHDWIGWVPFDDLPHRVDPTSGALANANNRVAPAEAPVFLGKDWPGDWRFRRIGELLAAKPQHAAADFASMQRDTVSLLAREILQPAQAVLRRLPRQPGAAGKAQELLLDWDGDVAGALPQPLIFNAWLREFGAMALAAGGVPEGMWHAQGEFLRRLLAPDRAPDRAEDRLAQAWCAGDCTALAARALERAVAGLRAELKPDPASWRWDRLHVARFEHPVLRGLPGFGWLSRLQAPTGGDEWTLSRGGLSAEGWTHVHGAGLRLVADLAAPDRTLAIIATGQSGHPLSRHWADLLPLWRDGGMLELSNPGGAAQFRFEP